MSETATLEIGQRVRVVEHDERSRTPRPGGKLYEAVVVAMDHTYIQVRYDNRVLNAGRPDQFYAESGWRAWDGCMRWRLAREEGPRP